MKSDELLDAIGEAKDEYVHDVRNGKVKKMPNWAKLLVTAACIGLVALGAWDTLDRLDYHFFAAGCGAWPGEIVDGDYYYFAPHKGVLRYTPGSESELLLHTYWFEEWDVNEYGIYYWQGMSVYVRDHKTGTRTRLYTASKIDCTHIRFELSGDGNVIVTHYNKYTGVTYELLLDGKTGEVLKTVMEPTPNEESKYVYYSDTHYIVGERHIVLEPTDEKKNAFILTEDGNNLLPEGELVERYPEYFDGALWLRIRPLMRCDGSYAPSETMQYAVVDSVGNTKIVTIPNDTYYGGTMEYLFTVAYNSSEVLCVEVSSGDSWLLKMDTAGNFHDLASDGIYLYTTAPWDHVQTCWKLEYDETNRPIGMTLINPDIHPSD